MKKIFCGILLVAFAACKNSEPVNYTLFKGTIQNPSSERVMIIDGTNNLVKEMKVSEAGVFADTIFNANGYYTFNDGKEVATIYLQDGYDIDLSLNTKEFDESIKFSGKGSETNNYLAQKLLTREKMGSMADLYSLEEAAYLSKMNEFKGSLEKSLETAEADFAEKEKLNIKYEHLGHLSQYQSAHRYFAKKQDFEVSESFPDPFEGIDLNNEEHYKEFNAFKRLVGSNFAKSAREKAAKDSISYEKASIAYLKELKSEVIKNDILLGLADQVSIMNPNSEELYKAIMEISTDEDLKARLTTQYELILKLAKGKDSPTFENYENNAGGTTSLSDLKGKYVYIDVWATWCKPCIAEIPSLKKVEAQYHDKNIEFVSISIDVEKDHDLWKQMIKDENLGGIQLFADANWGSKFAVDYQIQGIPRFILIDPEGKIVNSFAPRPSDERLVALFDELKI